MAIKNEKVRLSLDVSSELNKVIEELAEKSGGTKSDVLRKAIALLELAIKAKERGEKIALVDKNQSVNTEIIGL